MPSIQSVGAVPGGSKGWGDLLGSMLEAGVLGNNKYQEDKQVREEKQREFDLKQQELDINKKNAKTMQQAQLWESLQVSAGRAGEAARSKVIAAGGSEQDAQKAYDYASRKLVTDTIGKNTDIIKDTYGAQALDYATGLAKTESEKPKGNPAGRAYTPQMFMQGNRYTGAPGINQHAQNIAALAGATGGPLPSTAPGDSNSLFNIPELKGLNLTSGAYGAPPAGGPMFNFGMGGQGGVNPDMQALMSLLAMRGQNASVMPNTNNNPYTDGSGVPIGPVSLGQ